ncbi:MAG: hypothetical protein M1820_002387 [Bogoriella megaspora]|nr:MAG: hypothetical protein M1820_002387 [Bogoriella megaspora]
MDGVVWEHSRTLLQPTLHKDRISNLGFFEKSLEQCITQIPGDGSTIDVQPLLSNLFIDTAANSLLGHPLGMMGETQLRHSPIDGKKFQKAFMLSLRGCAMRLELGIFAYFLPRSMTSDNWSVVHQLVDYCIDEAFKRKGQANVRDHDSLLDDLVEKTDDKLVIRNLVIQAMMASQDTTPTLIANAIFLLARSPSVWARLREEVATIKPGNYTPDNARKSKLLHHILLECKSYNDMRRISSANHFAVALRLCPVFSTFNRVALRHTTLPTGGGPTKDRPIFVPAGTVVAADFYALHRDKSFYGPNAESFDPDRWQHMQAGPWHYMGFGGGPRACLGKQKALTEASCALIRFAQAFSRIESRDSNPWTGDQKLVAKNVHGCKVALFAAKI